MEGEKRVLRCRKPLSDFTNLDSLTSSHSRSSSSSAFKKCKSATTTPSSNNSRNCVTRDHEVSEPISVVYSRRHTSEKRKNKEKAVPVPFSSTLICEDI